MKVKVLQMKGQAAVVINDLTCKIVSRSSISGRVNETIDISEEAWSAGTDYGIDWSIIFPNGFHFDSKQLQRALYDHGLYTAEDIRTNPAVVVSALHSLMKMTAVYLYRIAQSVIGGDQ